MSCARTDLCGGRSADRPYRDSQPFLGECSLHSLEGSTPVIASTVTDSIAASQTAARIQNILQVLRFSPPLPSYGGLPEACG